VSPWPLQEVLSAFGFTQYEVNLSTRPEKHVGEEEIWDVAEAALKEALDAKGWTYVTDVGGGAFYGPKIDIKIQDAIGRKWQCSTIQLDFNLPSRFVLGWTLNPEPFLNACHQQLELPSSRDPVSVCRAVPGCAVLCHAVLYCPGLYNVPSYHPVSILYCTALYCVMPCCMQV
jgi:hypothetical protein